MDGFFQQSKRSGGYYFFMTHTEDAMKRCLSIALFVLLCAAVADAAESRKYSLLGGGFLGTPLNEGYKDFAGDLLAGGSITFKYHATQRFAAGLYAAGALGSRENAANIAVSNGPELREDKFDRQVAVLLAPLQAQGSFELYADKSVNPFLGLAVGGAYTQVMMTADNVPADSQISGNDLTESYREYLFAASIFLGVDYRIIDHLGLFLDARYNYLSPLEFTYDEASVELVAGSLQPATHEVKEKMELSHIGGNIGVIVYF